MFFPLHDTNPTQRSAVVTYAIVAINVVVHLWAAGLGPLDQQLLAYRRGFVPARMAQLVHGQPIEVEIPLEARLPGGRQELLERQIVLSAAPQDVLSSWITTMFLHGGWLHLIGNMWFLLIFGDNVEDRLGHLPYAVFYLLGGLVATGCYWAMNAASTIPVIGASGAVAAVLGAYAVSWPWARVRTFVFLLFIITVLELPALLVLGAWFVLQLLSALGVLGASGAPGGGGIAWVAHVGGFLAGFLAMPTLSRLFGQLPPPPPAMGPQPFADREWDV